MALGPHKSLQGVLHEAPERIRHADRTQRGFAYTVCLSYSPEPLLEEFLCTRARCEAAQAMLMSCIFSLFILLHSSLTDFLLFHASLNAAPACILIALSLH